MSKTELDLNRVALWRCFSPAGSPAWLETPINGWDTETSDGNPIALSYAWDGEPGEAIHNDRNMIDSRTIFRMLTHRNCRAACNVWYNLDFDANVILAHLPPSTVYHITLFGQDDWNGYRIAYIPGKLLSIVDKHRHKCQHFDVSNIFFQTGGSLDGALQAWLGRKKRNENVDVTRFDDPEYIAEHWEEILRYAKADAEDVRDVWRAFVNVAEPLDVPCGRPYSTGYLAEQRYNVEFQKTGNSKPGFVNKALQNFAWKSYFGGRFEVIERGTIEDVITYDINSAYPAVLRRLPDPSTLWWRYSKRPSLTELEGADYGFVRAVVSTMPGRSVQPFAVRRAGRLTFPTLDKYPVTVTLPEFLFAMRSGLLRDATVTESWLGYADERTVFPFSFVDEIYAKRQELKRDGNDKAQAVLKILINSLYGKLAQLTKTLARTPEDATEWKRHWIWQPIETYPPHLREWLEDEGIEIHQVVKAGAYFNPVLASYVTAEVRLQLLRTVVEHELEDDIILLATDSVTFRRGVDLKPDLVDDRELGRWSVDSQGKMFLVGSGVYELETPSGEVKSRTRGFEPGIGVFSFATNRETTLREAAENAEWDSKTNQWVLPISNNRPLKIRQALWQNIDLTEVGRFRQFPRGLSAGMDVKRMWPRGRYVTFQDLLETSERSNPLRWRS